MVAGSFCLWWRQLVWLICWSRREISPCLPQAMRLLLDSLRERSPFWRVSLQMFVLLYNARGFQRLFCRTWDVSGVSGQKGHIQDRGTTGPGYLTRTHHFYFLWSGDPNALRTILLYHFSKGIFIGGGLESGVTNLLKSLQGSYLKVLFVSV